MKQFILALARLVYRILFKVEIHGIENIPSDKNFLVTPNHLSNFDPPLVAAFLPVDMAYMAKASLFKVPVVGWVIKAFGAFPVKKAGNDMSAVKLAIRILKEGKPLTIFPEGRRVKTPGVLGEGKPGAAMLATKAKVGFLPVGITARYRFRGKVVLTVGEYIDISEYTEGRLSSEDLQKLTDEVLMPRIAELAGAKTYGN
ncbi:MAG: 1-acyl-sn-glycerol-3-phosphate acyltransferase [Clostridia bacterium]|nr:1-acyl-sn-glycerol-3-phosphate acyltransferase [Oscillospiraceae bacterium]MBQ7960282.1 1-acyl-sn-glycerol-3-phosphate acyltransferase [Clostridia bacterium]